MQKRKLKNIESFFGHTWALYTLKFLFIHWRMNLDGPSMLSSVIISEDWLFPTGGIGGSPPSPAENLLIFPYHKPPRPPVDSPLPNFYSPTNSSSSPLNNNFHVITQ